jgi:hypothetical protein
LSAPKFRSNFQKAAQNRPGSLHGNGSYEQKSPTRRS